MKLIIFIVFILVLVVQPAEARLARKFQKRLMKPWVMQGGGTQDLIIDVRDYATETTEGLRDVILFDMIDPVSRNLISSNLVGYIRKRDIFFTIPLERDIALYHVRMNRRFTRGRVKEIIYRISNTVRTSVFDGSFLRL